MPAASDGGSGAGGGATGAAAMPRCSRRRAAAAAPRGGRAPHRDGRPRPGPQPRARDRAAAGRAAPGVLDRPVAAPPRLRMPGRLLGACSGLGGGQGARLAPQCRTPAASSVDERAVRPREAIEQVESGAHVAPRARLEQHCEGVERAGAVDLVQPQCERALGCALLMRATDTRWRRSRRSDRTRTSRAFAARSPSCARASAASVANSWSRAVRSRGPVAAGEDRADVAGKASATTTSTSGRRKRTRTRRGYRLFGRHRTEPAGRAPGGEDSGQAVLVACVASSSGSRWISRTASKSVLSILP